MEIKKIDVKIRDIINGYVRDTSDKELAVVGYGGKLNIRPAYQREFVYDLKKQKAVINSIMNKYPINTMYWVHNSDDTYEVLDGQQRTISFCDFAQSRFSYKDFYFHNFPKDKQEAFLDYDLQIYVCDGTDSEKLEWFQVINTNGDPLKDQEIRNAIYSGEWLSEAKVFFSKRNCPAYKLGKNYLSGEPNRQAFLETAISWIAAKEGTTIENYMAIHQHDRNCNAIWLYYQNVINWVKATFPVVRPQMKGIAWGLLFNRFGSDNLDPNTLESSIKKLMIDDDVSNKKGIYEYVLSKEEKCLNIRSFSEEMKIEAYERQNGICPFCQKENAAKIKYEINEMEADHITPWSKGGKTNAANCQMLCIRHNREKGGK